MKRVWAGLALLSASWLVGLSYYQADRLPTLESWRAWTSGWNLLSAGAVAGRLLEGLGLLCWPILLIAGAGLLGSARMVLPGRRTCLWILLAAVPVFCWLPWPYRGAILLLGAGALVGLIAGRRRHPLADGLIGGGLLAGSILLVQALVMLVYASATGRSHDLPDPLPGLLAGVARLMGLDAAACGPHVALHTMRVVHMLGATWELLLDPVTVSFVVGGLVLLTAVAREVRGPAGAAWWIRGVLLLLITVSLWLPLRAGLLMAAFIHRALLTDYDSDLNLMNQFWSPWTHLLLMAGPVLLAWRFVPAPLAAAGPAAAPPAWSWTRLGLAAFLAMVAGAGLGGAVLWHPVGQRQAGRVLVDEHHSRWERTDRPMDTEWYGHESGYNYACIYSYLSRFYEMARQEGPTTDELLGRYDVLMLKTPTSRYAPEEVEAILRFVERGGGLLLIGEHTNVFGTSTYLNQVAERLGFRFRPDCAFSISGSPFEQRLVLPVVPHPVLQHLPELDFAVSCTIDPGMSRGEAVILSTGLRNLPADYHVSNFYPQVTDRAESRYGAFVQLWSVSYGRGRVLAFTDSTIFSNFSTFEPGKAELMLGMIEWLNHRREPGYARISLAIIGGVAALLSLLVGWSCRGGGFGLVTAAALGVTVGGYLAGLHHGRAMPLPEPRAPMTRVVIDRTLCDGPLSRGGFIRGEENGFGIFERWILRLGYFNRRAAGPEATDGDLLVFFYPRKTVDPGFRQQIVDYVEDGGKVLVLDSPANTGSTSRELLEPFGLSLAEEGELTGELVGPPGWPTGVQATAARAVRGGEPLIRIMGEPVAATATRGRGSVTLIGFGSRFCDAQMGLTGDVVPTPELRRVYDLQFTLITWIVEGRLWSPPTTAPAAPPQP